MNTTLLPNIYDFAYATLKKDDSFRSGSHPFLLEQTIHRLKVADLNS